MCKSTIEYVKEGRKMSYQLKNDKNLFGQLGYFPFITVYSLGLLKKKVSQEKKLKNLTNEEFVFWKNFFETIEQLPIKKIKSRNFNNLNVKGKYFSWIPYEAYCLLGLESFRFVKENPMLLKEIECDIQKRGLDFHLAQKLICYEKNVLKFCKKNNLEFLYMGFNACLKFSEIQKNIENNIYIFQEVDLFQNICQTYTYAIYGKENDKEGFVNHKGTFGSLSSARLFETIEAARDFLKYRSPQYTIVELENKLNKIVKEAQVPTNSLLEEGIALIQKNKIQEALEKATQDQLLAQLEKIQTSQSLQEQKSEEKIRRKI